MAKMSTCKTCGKEIASSAKICPSCGAKNKKPFYTRWWFWLLIVIIALGAIGRGNEGSSTGETSVAQQPTVKKTDSEIALEKSQAIDYRVLYNDYQNNPINADSKYKDKYWKISGNVSQIDREIMGNPYVTFEIDFMKDIRITFAKSEEEKIASLSKGQKITVVGNCKGTLLSTTVAFDDCYLIE